MNRPKTNINPMIINGIPNITKKNGAPEFNAVVNQKIAKPHHNRLNGIKKMSAVLKTIPVFGRPVQTNFSLLSKCC
jgi:hypothetical protein